MLDEQANFTEITRLTQFCFLLQRSVYRWLFWWRFGICFRYGAGIENPGRNGRRAR